MPNVRIPLLVVLLCVVSSLFAPDALKPTATSPPPFSSRNVYLAGGNVRPGALVEGDLMAVGGKIVVDRGVTGDATLAAGSVEVLAAVGDDMRVVGGDVNISSTVGGELFATGGNVTLSRAARIGHGASLFGGVITIDGIVEGPLEIQAQKVIINGPVSGGADLSASEIELGQNAKIGGALNYNTPGEMRRQDSNPNR